MAMKAEYDGSRAKRGRLDRVRATAGLPGEPGRPALIILYAAIAIVVGLIGMLCLAVPFALVDWLDLPGFVAVPAVDDIAGVWAPTADSITTMDQAGHRIAAHGFNFAGDGSFVMANIPECVLTSSLCGLGIHASIVSGSGRWEIDADGGKVILHVAELDGRASDLEVSLEVWQSRGSYFLGFPIGGDPDGAWVYFKRQ